jgi:hypothetical protein
MDGVQAHVPGQLFIDTLHYATGGNWGSLSYSSQYGMPAAAAPSLTKSTNLNAELPFR